MPQFIDRRLNPRGKSLGNRQRFLRRTRAQIKQAVDRAVRDRGIGDVAKGGPVSISSDGVEEPKFQHTNSGGDRDHVLPGNREFVAGDTLDKPGEGRGGPGRGAADIGDGEDAFPFALSEDEFLDMLFDDLELPELVKATLKNQTASELRRAGFTNDGTTANLNVLRTMRQSMSRRLALGRPRTDEIQRLEWELEELGELGSPDEAPRIRRLIEAVERLKRLQRSVPYIDPIDVRYNRLTPKSVPHAKAVMFCLMDVSASMGEREKGLAKRFFILLNLFLRRRYDRVDMVFIRHSHEASEVGEQEFFYGRESGGTIVSTALKKMIEVRDMRYSASEWNVYCAQVSDGDNSGSDTQGCVALLNELILPLTQYFAYIEIAEAVDLGRRFAAANGKELWRGYAALPAAHANFAMKMVAGRGDIYPVFRELFSRQTTGARMR